MTRPTARLAELAEINPKPSSTTRPDTTVSFVGMADVDAATGTTTRGTPRPFGEVAKGYTQFDDGDLIVAKITPCFENGKIAQATLDCERGAGSTEFHVIRPDRSRVDGRYLLHFLRQPTVRAAGEVRMTGSGGQRRVPEAYLRELGLPVLPLEEQRRAAAVLDAVEALRVLRRRTLTALDGLIAAIFVDTFGCLATNPRGFRTKNLGSLARIIRGASPRPKGDPRYFGGPIPWLMISDLTRTTGNTVTRIRQGVTPAGRDKSVFLPAGSLVLTNSATVGIPKFLGMDACIHDGFLGLLDVDEQIHPAYLYHLPKNNRTAISHLAPEGTQKNLNTAIVKAIEIPVPSDGLQRKFVKDADLIYSLQAPYRAHLAELDALFASVQDRAFRGEPALA